MGIDYIFDNRAENIIGPGQANIIGGPFANDGLAGPDATVVPAAQLFTQVTGSDITKSAEIVLTFDPQTVEAQKFIRAYYSIDVTFTGGSPTGTIIARARYSTNGGGAWTVLDELNGEGTIALPTAQKSIKVEVPSAVTDLDQIQFDFIASVDHDGPGGTTITVDMRLSEAWVELAQPAGLGYQHV